MYVAVAEAELIVEKGSKKQTKLMNKEATLIVHLSWSIGECILWYLCDAMRYER